MNWVSARSSRAAAPHITVKRDLASLTARAKSSTPSASPSTSWGFGSKSNGRGWPQRRTSTFSSSVVPGGTEGCGRLGSWRSRRLDLRVDLLELGVQLLDALADLAHPRHHRLGILAPALGLADGFGGAVALRLERLDLGDEPAALGVLRDRLAHQLGAAAIARARAPPPRDSRGGGGYPA